MRYCTLVRFQHGVELNSEVCVVQIALQAETGALSLSPAQNSLVRYASIRSDDGGEVRWRALHLA